MDDTIDELDDYNPDDEYDIIVNETITNNMEDYEEFKKTYNKQKKKNITTPTLSKYEKTRVLSERTHQIENGSVIYITNVDRFTDAYSIAIEEFNLKKIPFIIRRPLPNLESFEYWKLSDMIY
jgi:DNA-directed RNA polymerase subunit K/omega